MTPANTRDSTPPLSTPTDPIRAEDQMRSAIRVWLQCPVDRRPSPQALGARIADIAASIAPDPIHAAIEAHRAAYAAYDGAAEAPDDENQEAFRELDRASQRVMRAEASTLAGLTALLRYVAPLLQEAGAPGLPIEIPFAGRWSAAFGTFCANVADRLTAMTEGFAATPERVDRVADAIVEATAPLIDDFEVARRAARAAIEALLAGKAVQS
jgi:hypothetical protein